MSHHDHDHNEGEQSSSTAFNAVGIVLLILSPIIGGVFASVISYQKSFVHVINAFAGGILLGMGLLHMLSDAVSEYPVQDDDVQYPYPYLITGCTLLFMFMLTSFVPIGVEMTYRSSSSIVDKVNVTAVAFFIGLAVHGIFEGFAIGILDNSPSSWVTLILLIVHKCIEFAALSSILLRLKFSSVAYYTILEINIMPCVVTFIITFTTAATYASLTNAVFSALGSGTFLYLSLGHLIPEVLDPLSHHHSEVVADKPTGTVVTPYSSIIEQGINNSVAKNQKCSCCQDGNCQCGDNCQCGFIDGLKSGSTSTPPHDFSHDHDADDEALKELLYFKLRAFTGIGLGFTAFALLALSPS